MPYPSGYITASVELYIVSTFVDRVLRRLGELRSIERLEFWPMAEECEEKRNFWKRLELLTLFTLSFF